MGSWAIALEQTKPKEKVKPSWEEALRTVAPTTGPAAVAPTAPAGPAYPFPTREEVPGAALMEPPPSPRQPVTARARGLIEARDVQWPPPLSPADALSTHPEETDYFRTAIADFPERGGPREVAEWANKWSQATAEHPEAVDTPMGLALFRYGLERERGEEVPIAPRSKAREALRAKIETGGIESLSVPEYEFLGGGSQPSELGLSPDEQRRVAARKAERTEAVRAEQAKLIERLAEERERFGPPIGTIGPMPPEAERELERRLRWAETGKAIQAIPIAGPAVPGVARGLATGAGALAYTIQEKVDFVLRKSFNSVDNFLKRPLDETSLWNRYYRERGEGKATLWEFIARKSDEMVQSELMRSRLPADWQSSFAGILQALPDLGGEAIGYMLPAIATSAVAGPGAGLKVAFASGYTHGFREIHERAKANGLGDDAAFLLSVTGAVLYGGIEVAQLRHLQWLSKGIRSRVVAATRRQLVGAIARGQRPGLELLKVCFREGLEEVAQGGTVILFADVPAGKMRTWREYREQAIAEFIAGFAMGGVLGGAGVVRAEMPSGVRARLDQTLAILADDAISQIRQGQLGEALVGVHQGIMRARADAAPAAMPPSPEGLPGAMAAMTRAKERAVREPEVPPTRPAEPPVARPVPPREAIAEERPPEAPPAPPIAPEAVIPPPAAAPTEAIVARRAEAELPPDIPPEALGNWVATKLTKGEPLNLAKVPTESLRDAEFVLSSTAMKLAEGDPRFEAVAEGQDEITTELRTRAAKKVEARVVEAKAPPEAAPPPAKPAKQPWEMTKAEFRESLGEYDVERLERIDVSDEGRLSMLDRQGGEWKRYVEANPQLRDDPDTVEVYRATEGKTLKPGDWIYLQRVLARKHKATRPGARILVREVPLDDITAGADATEFVYSPRRATEKTHREAVTTALREGKPVPAEVLKDYPDLAPAKPAKVAERDEAHIANLKAQIEQLKARATAETPQVRATLARVEEQLAIAEGRKPARAVEKPPREARRIISKDRYAQAVQRIKEARAKAKEKGEVGELDPGTFKEYAMAGAYHVQEGVLDFLDWSAKMVEVFGEDVRRHLDKIWASPEVQDAGEGKLKKPPTVRRMKEEFGVAPRLTKAEIQERAGLRRELAKNVRLASAAYEQGKADLGETHRVLLEAIEGQFPERIEAGLRNKVLAAKNPGAMRAVARSIQAKLMRARIPGTREAKGPPELTAREVLKAVMRKLEVRAPGIYMRAARDIVAMHGNLAEYARERLAGLDITEGERERLTRQLATARTDKEQTVLVAAIEMTAHRAQVRVAIKDLQSAQAELKKLPLPLAVKDKITELFKHIAPTTHTDEVYRQAKSLVMAAIEGVEKVETAEGTISVSQIPSRLVDRTWQVLADAGRTPLRDLDPATIRQLTNTLRGIAKQVELKNVIKTGRRIGTADEVGKEAADQVRRGEPKPETDFAAIEPEGKQEAHTATGRLLRSLVRKWNDLYTAAWKITHKDSEATRILGTDIIIEGTNEGLHFQRGRTEALEDFAKRQGYPNMHAFMMDHSPNYARSQRGFLKCLGLRILRRKPKSRIFHLPAAEVRGEKGGKDVRLTSDEVVELLGNLSDPQTMREFLSGSPMQIARKGKFSDAINLHWDDIQYILDQATEAEKQGAAFLHAEYNGPIRAAINEISMEFDGYEKAPRTEYHPRRRSSKDYWKMDSDGLRYWNERTGEDQGILKPRTGGKKPIIIGNAWDAYLRHVGYAGKYVGWFRVMRNAHMLLNHPDFKAAIHDRYGASMWRILHNGLINIEGMNVTEPGTAEKFVNAIVEPMYVGALGFRPQVMAFQAISGPMVLREVKAKYVKQGMLMPSGPKTLAELVKWNDQAWARFRGKVSSILGPEGGAQMLPTGKKARLSLRGIRNVDRQTLVMSCWNVAKAETAGEYPKLEGDDFFKAVSKRFDELVFLTQPPYTPGGRTFLAMEARKSIISQMASWFGTYPSRLYNMHVRDWLEYRDSKHTTADKGKYLKNTAIVMTNYVMVSLIGWAWYRTKRGWRDDDEAALSRIARQMVSRVLGIFRLIGPIASEGADSVILAWQNLPVWGRGRRDPISSAVERGVKALPEAVKAIKKPRPRARLTRGAHLYRSLDHAARGISTFTGIPYPGAKDMADSIMWVVDPEWMKEWGNKKKPGKVTVPRKRVTRRIVKRSP